MADPDKEHVETSLGQDLFLFFGLAFLKGIIAGAIIAFGLWLFTQ